MRCSILIATYNRQASLRRCLSALAMQEYRDYEIIVADDGSTDGTAEMMQREFPQHRVVCLDVNGGGPSARNRVVPLAQGEILVCIDDDCLAPPHWLGTYVAHFADPRIGAAGGPLVTASPSFCDRYYAAHYREEFEVLRRFERVTGWERLVNGNMAVPRRVIEQVGAFDHRMRRGADADLVRRILRAGYTVVADPALGVRHLKTYTLGSFLYERFYKSCGSLLTDVKEGSLCARRFVPFPNPAGTWRHWRNFRVMYGVTPPAFVAFAILTVVTRWIEVAGRAYYYVTIGRTFDRGR